MKKSFYFFVIIALMSSCSSSFNRPDKRDKYVGEYRLYEYDSWHGMSRGTHWNHYANSYDLEWYSHERTDTAQTLIVKKSPNDTVSLTFYIVRPFDFERVERLKKENEEIKKRNAESICGKDEPLKEIPTPTYDSKRDVVKTYDGYVEGHKIFLKDYKRRDYGYEASYTFDSVYLRNDTLRFLLQQHWDFKDGEWRSQKERYIAVKNTINQ